MQSDDSFILCTVCDPLAPVINGEYICSDEYSVVGSTCRLTCFHTFINIGSDAEFTCQRSRQWTPDPDLNLGRCVAEVGIIVGGIAEGLRYLDTARVYGPSSPTCHERVLEPFPYKVMGSATGFVADHGVVCGGAVIEYRSCHTARKGQLS